MRDTIALIRKKGLNVRVYMCGLLTNIEVSEMFDTFNRYDIDTVVTDHIAELIKYNESF